MGNCIIEQGRHANTRSAYSGLDPAELQEMRSRINIQNIIGANSEVTSAIEAHRSSLREQGIVQPPAPTETLKTVECPVNLRPSSIAILEREENQETPGCQKRSSSSISLTCRVDVRFTASLAVTVLRES